MARPSGSKNKSDKEEIQDAQAPKPSKTSSELEVKPGSLASDKTTTAPGIHEGKKPKYSKTEFGV